MEIYKDSSGALVIKGSLTVSHIESAHTKIEPSSMKTIQDMVLDLSAVDDIDISGLQLLYAIKRVRRAKGRSVSGRSVLRLRSMSFFQDSIQS